MQALFETELERALGQQGFHRSTGSYRTFLAVSTNQAQPASVVEWRVEAPDRCLLGISPQLMSSAKVKFVAQRLGFSWALLNTFYAQRDHCLGSVYVNLEDHTVTRGLSFCGKRADDYLVPDAVFLRWRGYEEARSYYTDRALPWRERTPKAIWRGSTTGRSRPHGNWRSLPRVALCRLSQGYPDLLDAGLTSVVQLSDDCSREINAQGLTRNSIKVQEFGKWRYQVDIDGNSSSWPGLFQKLLTGSPVLKVTSEVGWRQWYYDSLKPWKNFVPVEANMADLVEKIIWLQKHDAEAEVIGCAGRQLALALTYERELLCALPVINTALSERLPDLAVSR